jgi:anaphase-promoting complex subunit 10
MYSPSDDLLEAPVRSESQEDLNSEDEEEDEDDDEEDDEDDDDDDGDSSRQTVQRPPGGASGSSGGGDDGSTVVVGTVPTSDSVLAGSSPAAASNNHTQITAVPTLESLSHLREVGLSDVISWQLSSAKPGNGVEQLRSPSFDTYWQSDGVSQPHWIQIHLHRRLPLTHVALYLDYQLDESYTPKTLRVETGMTTQDLCAGPENITMELNEPAGWCILPIRAPPDPLASPLDDPTASTGDIASDKHTTAVKAHLIRLSVLSMHQNGRDTHIRRLALFCQRTQPSSTTGALSRLPQLAATGDTRDASQHERHTVVAMDVDQDDHEHSHDPSIQRSQLRSGRVDRDERPLLHLGSHPPDFASMGTHLFSTIR